MLSDEERKALEWLKIVSNVAINNFTMKQQSYFLAILNLIEKQSKEIEELKKEYERVRAGRNWLSEHISAQIATPELFDRLVEENYISKDKIEAKIEKLNKKYKAIESNYTEQAIDDGDFELNDYVELQSIQYADDILQSLLEKE